MYGDGGTGGWHLIALVCDLSNERRVHPPLDGVDLAQAER